MLLWGVWDFNLERGSRYACPALCTLFPLAGEGNLIPLGLHYSGAQCTDLRKLRSKIKDESRAPSPTSPVSTYWGWTEQTEGSGHWQSILWNFRIKSQGTVWLISEESHQICATLVVIMGQERTLHLSNHTINSSQTSERCPFDKVYVTFYQKMRTPKFIRCLFLLGFAGSLESCVKLTTTNCITDSQCYLFLLSLLFLLFLTRHVVINHEPLWVHFG